MGAHEGAGERKKEMERGGSCFNEVPPSGQGQTLCSLQSTYFHFHWSSREAGRLRRWDLAVATPGSC